MIAALARKFLADLGRVHGAVRQPAKSGSFLSDLAQVYATLPVASDDNLLFLATRFKKWRSLTLDSVRVRREKLPDDDPIRCPISLFRPKGYGRLETAHTRTLAWLLDPKGEHGFGTTLLAALFRHLCGGGCSDIVGVEVKSEYPIVQGRLDVLVTGAWKDETRKPWALVIEAKVDAQEGDNQLKRYDAWLRSRVADREPF